MYFTKKDYELIEKHLKHNAKKDTGFPDASLPLEGKEFLAIVQDGRNKKTSISSIYFGFN